MYELDKEQVKKILIEEMKLPAFDVELFLRDFPPLHDSLSSAVEQWLKDRTITEVVVEGLAITDVMKKRRSHFLAALRDLNILLDENIPVEKRQRYKETLKKPVHYK